MVLGGERIHIMVPPTGPRGSTLRTHIIYDTCVYMVHAYVSASVYVMCIRMCVCVCVYRVCISADPSPQQGGRVRGKANSAWARHVVQWLPQNVAHALAVSHAMVFWCAESIFEATSERIESESYYRHWQRLWAAGTIRPSLPWCFGVTSEDFL